MTQPLSDPAWDVDDVPVSIRQCAPPIGAVHEAAYHAAVAAEDALRDALAGSDGDTAARDALQAAETRAIASLLAYHDLRRQRT